jgi:hypothetical protein
MKPTPEFIQNKQRADGRNVARVALNLPKTDCHFLPPSAEFSGRGHGNGNGKSRSIRAVSEHYFNTEARGHFAMEAAFFAVILLTAAVPVVEVLRDLAHSVSGIL